MVGKIENKIHYHSEELGLPELDFNKITGWINSIISGYGFRTGEINYIFCNDEYILKVNREYLQHDYYTDIITFDYTEDNSISGDLFVSLDTVQSNSEKFDSEFKEELLRVIIHGILHLCGLKDKTENEAQEMRKSEDNALIIYNRL